MYPKEVTLTAVTTHFHFNIEETDFPLVCNECYAEHISLHRLRQNKREEWLLNNSRLTYIKMETGLGIFGTFCLKSRLEARKVFLLASNYCKVIEKQSL